MPSKIIIKGCQIICRKIVTQNFILPDRKRFILMGTVYTPYGNPLPDAAVEVTQLNTSVNPPLIEVLGITFSEKDGSYAISLPINDRGYIVKAYSP